MKMIFCEDSSGFRQYLWLITDVLIFLLLGSKGNKWPEDQCTAIRKSASHLSGIHGNSGKGLHIRCTDSWWVTEGKDTADGETQRHGGERKEKGKLEKFQTQVWIFF